MRRNCRAAILHVFAPLLLGSVIYLLFRDQNLPISLLFGSTLSAIRPAFFPRIPESILYSLPDALWVYSLTSIMAFIWQNSQSAFKAFWMSSGLLLAFAFELGQLAGVIPGTFDVLDLTGAALAASLALFLNAQSTHLKRILNDIRS
jgi:hypothetical protein